MADFDYQKMSDYVNADPEVTKLREKRTANYKKIEQLKTNSQSHIEKMHGLYLAKTAIIAKVQYEPAGSEADEILENITGQCSECWDADVTNSNTPCVTCPDGSHLAAGGGCKLAGVVGSP